MRKQLHLVLLGALAGCSGGGGGGVDDSRASKLGVGGLVYYCNDYDVRIDGVTVTLTGVDGDVETTTTAQGGLWEIEDVPEGVYSVSYAATGYESFAYVVAISQPEGSPTGFVALGDDCLVETRATVTVSPFGTTLLYGGTLVDGVAGQSLVYSKATDGDIVLTFDRPTAFAFAFGGGGPVTLQDGETGGQIAGTPNPDHTTFTFAEASLNAFNAGAGLSTNGTLHFLNVSGVPTWDPINGGQTNYYGYMRFRVTP